jgi:hypothetical protein
MRYVVDVSWYDAPGDRTGEQLDALAILMDAECVMEGTYSLEGQPVQSLSFYLMGKRHARAFLAAAKEHTTLFAATMAWEPKNAYLYLARIHEWDAFWSEVGTSLRRLMGA